MPKNQLHGHLAMILFSFCIAGSFSMGGDIAKLVAPDALTAMRFLAATIFMGILVALSGKWGNQYLKAFGRYIFLGAIFAIYFVTMFEALTQTTPVSAATVATLIPLMTALFGYVLLGQKTTRRMAIALTVGAIGTVWVIFRADFQALVAFNLGQGEAIFFGGCLAHALYAVLFRKMNRDEPLIISTFGVLAGGTFALFIYAWKNVAITDWISLPTNFWLIFAYFVIITSALTFFLVQFAALRLPSAKVMAYTYLVPSWVILWQWFFGKGLPEPKIAFGVAITIIALILLLKNEETA